MSEQEWGPCAQCDKTAHASDDEWAEGWLTVEDEALVMVYCSVGCLAQSLEPAQPDAQTARLVAELKNVIANWDGRHPIAQVLVSDLKRWLAALSASPSTPDPGPRQ